MSDPARLAEIKAQLARLADEPNSLTRTSMLIDLGRDAAPWLVGEVTRLRGLLRRLEDLARYQCPVCGDRDDPSGHAPGCELAAALSPSNDEVTRPSPEG